MKGKHFEKGAFPILVIVFRERRDQYRKENH